ncbi:sun protein [Sulfuricella denitrificans skB26]|uniref:16S rRNA (cytosine(967)-C(5))-methyltransferase n=1 Tax=Sulfuricella denitrificans (strain DSM 22764 / NBRC 105220 / skB26) TaxID=1163617 RepID=S6ADW2_SULDS|nr:16S rRNA (cytosine(967)-C(5))-methyltransferase RsmB [Sulfuricella denitrificans]BAN33861.1 sun protein [Sulfuricella denitrificans skB26]
MIESQRLASTAVSQVLAGRNLNQVLQSLLPRHSLLTPQQRAAAQDMSYGTLRFYGQLRSILDLLLQKPIQDAAVRSLLLVALYQLQYSRSAEHAVVDHAVRAAETLKKPWAKGLVNAVLRNFLRQRISLLEQAAASEEGRYSHPQWWIEKLRRQYPDDWATQLEINNQHPPMTLRVNARVTSTEIYLDLLHQQGIEGQQVGENAILLDQPVSVDKLPGFGEGVSSVQDAGAQFAARLLDVADGMRVLDACAAPGGKAAHLLELARIELTALDSDPERLKKIEQTLQRLKLEAHCLTGNAARPDEWWDGKPFQRILADVPCSASGVVRRHPDIKWLRREVDITAFAAQQAEILDALWRVLGSGGKLLYATCSVFAEENQQQIAQFLVRHEDAQCLPLSLPAMKDGQLTPNLQHDGFFYALLLKA